MKDKKLACFLLCFFSLSSSEFSISYFRFYLFEFIFRGYGSCGILYTDEEEE